MLKKELILDLDNLDILGKNIKDFFCSQGNYFIIKNYNNIIKDE